MFEHDRDHNSVISMMIGKRPTDFNRLRSIYYLKNKLKKSGSLNDAKILEDGLFVIVHEFDGRPGMGHNKSDFYKKTAAVAKVSLTNPLAKGYVSSEDMGSQRFAGYGSLEYKRIARDNEFILKDKYFDSKKGRFTLVHDEHGPFLPIEYDETSKKITRPFADIAPLGEKDPTRIADRKAAMIDALTKGYARFWNYFLKIIEENLDPESALKE